MYRDNETGLGIAPLVAAGAATSAVKGVANIIGGIFGGGGPSYARSVKRVEAAYKLAAAGDSKARTYDGVPSTGPVDPITFLTWYAGLVPGHGSSYPEARSAALAALQRLATTGSPDIREQVAPVIEGAGDGSSYAPPASTFGGVSTGMVMAGVAVVAGFFLLRGKGRRRTW